MAEAAALASIAKSALQLFTSLAKDEFLLLRNSQKDLQSLEATIQTLTYIHQDSQETGSDEGAVQHCLSRLRNVMYNAEDLFDGLAARILHKKTMTGNAFTKEVRLFFSDANQLGLIYKTAHKVKAIKESVDGIKKDMEVYRLIRQPSPVVQPFVRPKTHSYMPDEDVIGRDEDRDRIIDMLLPQSQGETPDHNRLSVIAIIGFGGLGKTTLAQYVYNDARVKQGFEVQLWACINDLSDLELVLIEIIGCNEEKPSNLSLQMLQEKLKEIISGRKFLLILDDVWDENSGHWLKLEHILSCGKIGSKVLATTRSRKVVKCLDASKPNCCVDLAVLSKESAWSLFVKRVFCNRDELSNYPELEPIGKKIVDRFGNVPLAINVVGSLLRQKEKDGKIWSDFLENDIKRTIAQSGDKNEESIKSVLMVSYNDLLPNLKLCFAYCSVFPKDYEFDKDELVRLWIAQGFIKPLSGIEQRLEKEGEDYFFHLVERCFFQEVKQKRHPLYFEDQNDRYRHTAKMHDLIHDMAIEVAKTESAFIGNVSMINQGKRDNLRHIFICCELDNSIDYCSLVSDPKLVRTLKIEEVRGKRFSIDPPNMWLDRFRLLRVLSLTWLRTDKISDSLGELIHLRYLNLSYNKKIKNLPNSICNLHQLMMFILVGCELLEDLPPKIEKLVSLRQLCIHGCESLGSSPSGLRGLTSLVKLDRLIVDCQMGGLRYLEGLDNLHGILAIEFQGERWPDAKEDARKANMSGKTKLSGMIIKWKDHDDDSYWLKEDHDHQNVSKDEAKAVLDALEPHKNLEYLQIENYHGEILSTWVGRLEYVTELHLHDCCQVEYLLEDEIRGDLFFPFLKSISLFYLPKLKGWWGKEAIDQPIKRPQLPKVSSVHISNCPKLKGRMPLFEEVEELDLCKVNMEVVTELLMGNRNPDCSPLTSFSKLKTLSLVEIGGLTSLPEGWLRCLTHLQMLNIESCVNLKWVSSRGLAHLTALKELRLEDAEITDMTGDEEGMRVREAGGMPWKALKGLETLTVKHLDEQLIEGLQYLMSLKWLEIINWKEEELRDEKLEANRLESSFKALRNLLQLKIGYGKRRTAQLPFKVIQYLPSLVELHILNCKELYLGWKTLLSSKLETLLISDVEKVMDVEDKAVEQQSQLRDLTIYNGAAEWVDDVPWISLSSLHYLYLSGIRGMEQLPDGIQHLISLKTLSINERCSEVKSLPIWIPKLTSLRRLTIENCSAELERRCEKESGEDWPLIRHLPNLQIEICEERESEVVKEENGESGERSRKKRWGCGLSLSKFHL